MAKISDGRFRGARRLRFVSLALLLLSCFHPSHESAPSSIQQALNQIKNQNVRNSGLYDTAWPIDHGDSARNKFGINTGFLLPSDGVEEDSRILTEDDFDVQRLEGVTLPQWFTTREKDEIFLIAGSRANSMVVKVNTTTMEQIQTAPLNNSLYIGGLAVLRNGHVYSVLGNKLYRFWKGDLSNKTVLDLPPIEGGVAQTNGMIVANDGYIIIKSWPFNFNDMGFFFESMEGDKMFVGVIVAGAILGMLVNSQILQILLPFLRTKSPEENMALLKNRTILNDKNRSKQNKAKSNSKASDSNTNTRVTAKSVSPLKTIRRGAVGGVVGGIVAAILMFGILSGIIYILAGPFSPYQFVFGEWRHHYSRISVVDPNTMKVVNCLDLTTDRLSFARTALVADSVEKGVDNYITVGDEFVFRFKYFHSNHSLILDHDWTERYRTEGDGSFPGTGPTVLHDVVYFTDNTFPVYLGPVYRMYRKSLRPLPSASSSSSPSSRKYEKMQVVNVNQEGEPGFMFWSVVAVPQAVPAKNGSHTLGACILVWDTLGRTVQCRHVDDMRVVWETHGSNSDCATSAIRTDANTPSGTQSLVYFSDYSQAPVTSPLWMRVTGIHRSLYKDTTKYLMVGDGITGKTRAKIAVTKGDSVIYPSMIISGSNNDVFMSARDTFIRISQKKKSKINIV